MSRRPPADDLSWWRTLPWRVRPEEWLLLPLVAALALIAVVSPDRELEPAEMVARVASEASYGTGEFAHFWYFSLWLFGGGFALSLLIRSPLMRRRWARWRREQASGDGAAPRWLVRGLFRSHDDRRPHDWSPAGAIKIGLTAARDYLPFLLCLATYALLRDLVQRLRPDTLYDAELRWLDQRILGGDPFLVVRDLLDGERIARVIEPLSVVSYSSYIYAVPLLACLLYAVNDVRGFRHLMLAVSLASFAGYLGYLAVPAVGPCDAFPDAYERAAGDGASLMVAMTAFRGDLTRDAFPSLHTAWTVIFLLAAWRYRRWAFVAYLPFAAFVFVAMFYYGKHYGVDVLAGIALALAAWRGARWIDATFEAGRRRHGLPAFHSEK